MLLDQLRVVLSCDTVCDVSVRVLDPVDYLPGKQGRADHDLAIALDGKAELFIHHHLHGEAPVDFPWNHAVVRGRSPVVGGTGPFLPVGRFCSSAWNDEDVRFRGKQGVAAQGPADKGRKIDKLCVYRTQSSCQFEHHFINEAGSVPAQLAGHKLVRKTPKRNPDPVLRQIAVGSMNFIRRMIQEQPKLREAVPERSSGCELGGCMCSAQSLCACSPLPDDGFPFCQFDVPVVRQAQAMAECTLNR